MLLTGSLLNEAYEELCNKLNDKDDLEATRYLVTRIIGIVRKNSYKSRLIRRSITVTEVGGKYPFIHKDEGQNIICNKQLAVALFQRYQDFDPRAIFSYLTRLALEEGEFRDINPAQFVKFNFIVLVKKVRQLGERKAYGYSGLAMDGELYETSTFNPTPIDKYLAGQITETIIL